MCVVGVVITMCVCVCVWVGGGVWVVMAVCVCGWVGVVIAVVVVITSEGGTQDIRSIGSYSDEQVREEDSNSNTTYIIP